MVRRSRQPGGHVGSTNALAAVPGLFGWLATEEQGLAADLVPNTRWPRAARQAAAAAAPGAVSRGLVPFILGCPALPLAESS